VTRRHETGNSTPLLVCPGSRQGQLAPGLMVRSAWKVRLPQVPSALEEMGEINQARCAKPVAL
jgi:hypothetical protein